MNNQEVDVKVCSFIDLFEKAEYPIAIDVYQRPYVWGEDKVRELIRDLETYSNDKEKLPYYMGSVLLHRNDENGKLYIIDGQQRLTTLCILYYVMYKQRIKNMEMEYHSPLSVKNIKNTQKIFQDLKEQFQDLKEQFQDLKEQWKDLFSKISFTCIITYNEDMAFIFFDTQNNRGIKLKPTDLLKAHHLRAIGNVNHFDIQENCAKRWEKIQSYNTLFGQKKDFAAELFHQFLWRARVWRGQRVIGREEDEHVLNEFQKNTLPNEDADTIFLYPNFNNIFGKKLSITVNQGHTIFPANIVLSNKSVFFPFTLRQPINEGLGFFLFSEKYADLVQMLFREGENKDDEIKSFQNFFNQVWTNISFYLKELFVLALVMYYDKFANTKLLEYTLWLDHILGAIRIEKRAIYKAAPLKFLKESDNNLLDVISQAFRAEEVIQFLKSKNHVKKIYKEEEIEIGKGVQGVYKDQILKYYGKENTLADKERWINDNFINEKRIKNGN